MSRQRLFGRLSAICAVLAACIAPAFAVQHYSVAPTFSVPGGGSTMSVSGGAWAINFTAEDSNSLFCQPTGSSVVPLVRILAYAGTEMTVKNTVDSPYTVAVRITDDDAGGSATATFTGRLRGYFSQGESALENTFTGAQTQALQLNGKTFTVTIGPFIPPGAPISSLEGLISATVTCAPTAVKVSNVVTSAGPLKVGAAVEGTVTLNGPAPAGGATVILTSAKPAALSLPASVTVPAGAASATFYGKARAAEPSAGVQASWNGTTASATVVIGAGGVCGDTNGDGQVTITDVARWLRAVGGLAPMPDC